MRACPAAVLDRPLGEPLLAMASAVLHQRTTEAPGHPGKLNTAQREALAAMVESGPMPRSMGRTLATERLGDVGLGGVPGLGTLSRILRALGYRKLSARPRHHAQAAGAVDAWGRTAVRTFGGFTIPSRPARTLARAIPNMSAPDCSAWTTRCHQQSPPPLPRVLQFPPLPPQTYKQATQRPRTREHDGRRVQCHGSAPRPLGFRADAHCGCDGRDRDGFEGARASLVRMLERRSAGMSFLSHSYAARRMRSVLAFRLASV